MAKASKVAVVGLLVAFALLYIGAKVHFFTRFRGDCVAYAAEHWPFWAGMIVIAWLLRAVGVAAEKRGRRGSSVKSDPAKEHCHPQSPRSAGGPRES
jgi:hypothetical protein